MRAPIAVAALALACCASATVHAQTTTSVSVNLDRDAHRERVERVSEPCPLETEGPYPCGFVRIVDGAASAQITPIDQRPRFDYGWTPRPVKLHDLTGDGRPELIWRLDTSGGTGSSPVRLGVHRWTGRRAVQLFATSGTAGRTTHAQPLRLDVLAPRRGLRELRLVELLYRERDATCCPSFRRTRRYRFDGSRMAAVRGSTRVTRLGRG